MTKRKKPNFIIIGAMKAATTSLYTYLKQHPDVFMTAIKEPMFFNNFQKPNNYKLHGRKTKKITTFKQYYPLFDDVKNAFNATIVITVIDPQLYRTFST